MPASSPPRRVVIVGFDAAQILDITGPSEGVADSCGFGTVETMRRAFARSVHASPGDYRERFRSPANARARQRLKTATEGGMFR